MGDSDLEVTVDYQGVLRIFFISIQVLGRIGSRLSKVNRLVLFVLNHQARI